MEIISIFAVLSIIIFLGFFAEQIFKKTNIPDIVFLISIGIIISTILNLIDVNTLGSGAQLFTTFALVFILFQGALSIDFKVLFKSLKSTFTLTIINFTLTVLVIIIIAHFMGYDLLLSILIGTILGGTSSAVVIPLVNNIEIKDKYGIVLTLESALSDVLCIIGTVTVLEIIETKQIIASNIFRTILSSFSLALLVGVAAGFVWIIFLSKYESLTKSEMVTIAALIGLYSFVESSYVQASGAIAALAFGLVLGNSKSILTIKNKKKSKDEQKNNVLSNSSKNFFSEISFFTKTFFFVYLGILIDFSNPLVFVYGFILTLGMYLIRPLSVYLTFNGSIPEKERTFLEILIPKGLAAAVLAGLAMQKGVFGDESVFIVNLVLSVILLSILFTSVLVFITEKEWFNGFLPFFKNSKN